jgi:hypothetical protein
MQDLRLPLGSSARKGVGVQVSPSAPFFSIIYPDLSIRVYFCLLWFAKLFAHDFPHRLCVFDVHNSIALVHGISLVPDDLFAEWTRNSFIAHVATGGPAGVVRKESSESRSLTSGMPCAVEIALCEGLVIFPHQLFTLPCRAALDRPFKPSRIGP